MSNLKLLTPVVVMFSLLALTGCPGQPECEFPDAGEVTQDGGGTVPDAGALVDGDYSVMRFNADGTLDNNFGTGGVTTVDLSTGAGTAIDSLWGGTTDPQGRVLLFGAKRGDKRVDTDRVVVRLTAAGVLDEGFADKGVYTLNIGNFNDSARHGFVQPDGKILSSGYMAFPTGAGTQSSNRVVLVRLNDNGTADDTFGVQGVVSSNPFVPVDPTKTPWGMVEAYGVVLQGDKYVTAGYGYTAPVAGNTVDLVSLRYTAEGVLDSAWGTGGSTVIDVAAESDRARNLIRLPDDRILAVGSGTPTKGNIDAMAVILTAAGTPDPAFGTGGRALYDFERPDEGLYGVAVNAAGTWAAAVGYRAGKASGVVEDDDAILLLIKLDNSAPPVALPVPLSETANDRLWSVAFDGSGKIVATGFVAEGTDHRTVLVRFNADGTRDASFGANGLVTHNLAPAGTLEAGRSVMVLNDGKLVVAGNVDHP